MLLRAAMIASVLLTVGWQAALAADFWLCIEEMATGFIYGGTAEGWAITNFKPNKFLVRRIHEKEGGFRPETPSDIEQYGVFAFGTDELQYRCNSGFYLTLTAHPQI